MAVFSGDKWPRPPYIQETFFRDERTHPVSATAIGANNPVHKVVANDGGGGTSGNSIGFNGSSQYATLADNAEIDAIGDGSWSFWLIPFANFGTFIHRSNYFVARQNYTDLVIQIADAYELFFSGALVDGIKHHIVITAEDLGAQSRIRTYIDGTLQSTDFLWGYALSAQTGDYTFGVDDSGDYAQCHIDEAHMYNVVLDQAQITEMYNLGNGIVAVPTGVTEATELVYRFHFDSGSVTDNDSTLGAGHDLVLTGTPTEENPIITTAGTSASLGVVALAWPPDITTHKWFSQQFDHDIEEGSDVDFHIHFGNGTGNSGNVIWGVEYMWTNVNDTWGNTTVVETAVAAGAINTHLVSDLDHMSGTGKKISSVMLCRLYRKGDDALDTFPDDIFMQEADFHIRINSPGSRLEWVK